MLPSERVDAAMNSNYRRTKGRVNPDSPFFSTGEEDKRLEWKPKRYSDVTIALAFMSAVFFGVFAIDLTFSLPLLADASLTKSVLSLKDTFPIIGAIVSLSLPLSIVFLVLALGCETYSRRRVPPPAFRVKNYLTKALIDLGVIGRDVRDYVDVLWVSPTPKFNRDTKCYSLKFRVNSIKFTPDKVEKMEDGLGQGFPLVQSANTEPDRNKKGDQTGWIINLWYTNDPYTRVLDKQAPW